MNAKKTSLVLGLVSCGAFALVVGCAGDGGTTPTGGTTTATGGNTTSNGGSNTSNGGSTTPTGGSTTPSGGGDTVTFASGQGVGPMTGYGYGVTSKDSKLTQPTCKEGGSPTSAGGCKETVWNKTDALCISGSIPALSAAPLQSEYDNNWGVQIGVNAKEPSGAIGKSFSSVDVKVTGGTGYRVMLHKLGDPDGTTYCFTYAAGPIKVTDFNTKCWGEPTTVNFAAADAEKVDKIMVQISSTASAITVTDFCLSSITLK